MPIKKTNILALDVGERRIGVAAASTLVRLASPIGVVVNDESVWSELAKIAQSEDTGLVVVGLPRSLQSEDTAQTKYVRSFAQELEKKLHISTVLQDEALTSRQAEAELRARGKKFEKGDIDALAATYILDDYLGALGTIESTER